MSLPTDKLRSVIDLEREKQFQNNAVIGGLDRFIAAWKSEVAQTITDKATLSKFNQFMAGFNYGNKDINQRAAALDELLFFAESLKQPKAFQATKANAAKATPEKHSTPTKRPPHKRVEITATHPRSLETTVTALKGINQTTAVKFAKLGIRTIRDLLYHFPNRHIDYSHTTRIAELSPGPEQTVSGTVWESRLTNPGGRRSTEVILGDETGNIRSLWFNNPYLLRQIQANDRIIVSGRVSLFKGTLVFESPEWEKISGRELVHTGRLVPVYPLTAGLYPRMVRKLLKELVDTYAPSLPDYLPNSIKMRANLLDLPQAIAWAHFPSDEAALDKARTRLAFDELFVLQLGVMARKRAWRVSQPGVSISVDRKLLDRFLHSLSYELTNAQQKALSEILNDLKHGKAMSRLLQGDVGSGKTVVATAVVIMSIADGYQAAFMAPTEILAEQHYRSITSMLELLAISKHTVGSTTVYDGILPNQSLTVAMLIGDAKESGKSTIRQQIQKGEIDLVIGTHALIQKSMKFHKLGLAVIDEQHRFGVEQRQSLRQKGINPHILVMTATPIPRTLALTLYGDLDLSVIDEIPPGRQIIKTKWLKPEQRNSAYAFIRKQVNLKEQAFIICPLVEESEAVQAKAATAEYETLRLEVFPEFRLGLIHGRMSSAEKEAVMYAFSQGVIDILVSTPVIEVGIDVPNATVMLIESADRFGLSQLHQFRGRVGRGSKQSYCMLLSENPSEIATARLSVIEKNHDGFVLAEEDLKLRGPGEFFGTRQSGLPDLKMAKLSDVPILETARAEAIRLFEEDPKLQMPKHRQLYEELNRVWPNTGEWS